MRITKNDSFRTKRDICGSDPQSMILDLLKKGKKSMEMEIFPFFNGKWLLILFQMIHLCVFRFHYEIHPDKTEQLLHLHME